MAFLLLSSRGGTVSLAQCCVNEFEDVMSTCGFGIVTPETVSAGLKLSVKLSGSMLIIACMTIYDARIVDCIPKWRSRFDKVYIYIFDAFINTNGFDFNPFSRFRRLIRKMDAILVPISAAVNPLSEAFGVKVEMIPLAADVVQFGSDSSMRQIDINAYGRQPNDLIDIIEPHFNSIYSKRILYHTNHQVVNGTNNCIVHRRFFWKILTHSRISICYESLNSEARKFPYSFVGQRWFESTAAGCVIVGRRPVCEESSVLFDWDGSVIELPDIGESINAFLENLLENNLLLTQIGKRNHLMSLLRHDWAYRLRDIFHYSGQTYPASLRDRLALLSQRASLKG